LTSAALTPCSWPHSLVPGTNGEQVKQKEAEQKKRKGNHQQCGSNKAKSDSKERTKKHPLSCSDLIHRLIESKVILDRVPELPTLESGATTIDRNDDIIQPTSQIIVPIAPKAEVNQLASRTAVSIEFWNIRGFVFGG
jgi:hypothetical protein